MLTLATLSDSGSHISTPAFWFTVGALIFVKSVQVLITRAIRNRKDQP